MKNIFEQAVSEKVIDRINKLEPTIKPQWGKMSVDQMLAHCNVAYELVYEDKHPKPNDLKTFFLKMFVKNIVVGEKPYKRNSPTAPEFRIKEDKDFEKEKDQLIQHIRKTQELGKAYFDGKKSHSFGNLTASEWNVMFYKHLDHHLTQFGV